MNQLVWGIKIQRPLSFQEELKIVDSRWKSSEGEKVEGEKDEMMEVATRESKDRCHLGEERIQG